MKQQRKNEPPKDIKTCISCGKRFRVASGDIEFAPDPYAAEIAGDETPVWECRYCRIDSHDSV